MLNKIASKYIVKKQALQKVASAYLEKLAYDKYDDYDHFYGAIANAETGSEKDRWIRTRGVPGESSSAWGEVQLTKYKADDYFDRFKEDMAPYKEFYDTVLNPMYVNFLEYGREPNKPGYDPRWEYGAYGIRLTDEQKDMYRNMTKAMMRVDEREARRIFKEQGINPTADQLFQKRIELWRGKPLSSDKRYKTAFYSYWDNPPKTQAPIVNTQPTVKAPVNTTTAPKATVGTHTPAPARVQQPTNQAPVNAQPAGDLHKIVRGDTVNQLLIDRGYKTRKALEGAQQWVVEKNKLPNINSIQAGKSIILPPPYRK